MVKHKHLQQIQPAAPLLFPSKKRRKNQPATTVGNEMTAGSLGWLHVNIGEEEPLTWLTR